ncbi:hypothetical protein LPJ56_001653 [Coemansia sp. RSA 2599]|nr:hypothetical protein LPJ56_001653 [Coemansia sp. RSA 2599]
MQELILAFQILQPQVNQSPNRQGLTEMLKKLYLEIHKRQQQAQQQQQQQQQMQQPGQQQLQPQPVQQISNLAGSSQPALSVNGPAGVLQAPQLQQQLQPHQIQQLQQLQMRIQQAQQQSQQSQQQQQSQNQQQHLASQAHQAQIQALQQQGQNPLAAAANLASSPHAHPAASLGPGSVASAVGGGAVSAEVVQKWRAAFAKIKRVFYYNGASVSVNLLDAHAVLNLLKQRSDTQNEEVIKKIIQEIMEAAQEEMETPLDKFVIQAVLHDGSNGLSFGAAGQKQPAPGEAQVAPAPNGSLAGDVALGSRPVANNAQHPQHGALQGQGLLSSPATSMGALPAGQQSNLGTPAPVTVQSAVSPATNVAVKKQASAKGSPSVASAKPKKKSQSPKTATKPRKGASPKPPSVAASAASTAAQAQTAPVAVAAAAAPPPPPTAAVGPAPAGSEASLTAPGMQRQESMSAETAARVVETIVRAMEAEPVVQRPRINLSESDKKAVRDHLVVIGQLLEVNHKLMAVLFLATKSQEPIQKICTIDIVVKEQHRLLSEDQYIIGPAHTTNFIDMLRKFFIIAKEWGSRQQLHDAAGSGASQRQQAAMSSVPAQPQIQPAAHVSQPAVKTEQETPLTNMHPSALTADPSFENFQKAVKHPLDPGNLKLPAAKKRLAGKSGSSAAGSQVMPPDGSSGPQQSAVSFAPAPIILPPNMSRAEFDKLPPDTRALILRNQQTMLIRQHALGMSGAAGAPDALLLQQQGGDSRLMQLSGGVNGQEANPLLLATAQGMPANATAAQTAEEQRLQELERSKWDNPLDYLMCVLDRFSKGAERAGVEPKPILQQAFWPIARKSMSSGWGVVASDAVL